MTVDSSERAGAIPDSSAYQRLIARYFESPNQLSPTTSNRITEALLDAIERFERGPHDRPVLLPMLLGSAASAAWAVVCTDERQLRTVDAELNAFLGPTYVERLAFNDASDEALAIRRALDDKWPHVLLLRSTSHARNAQVAQLWATRWKLWNWQPDRPTLELRSFAQLRAAFDRALLAHNEQAAIDAMAALRQSHGLSAENRIFLEIRLAAAFERWDNILEHSHWAQLLQLRLPPETYGDLWDALYEGHLRQHELTGRIDLLVGAFDRDVRVTAAPLLRSLGSSKRPAALKAFVLNELSQAKPSLELLTDLLSRLPPDAFGTCTQDVRDSVDRLHPNHQVDVAIAEMDKERYEQAYAMLWPLDDSTEVLSALLRCAREIDDPRRAQDVLHRLDACSCATELRDLRPRLIEAVERIAAQSISVLEAISPTQKAPGSSTTSSANLPPDSGEPSIIAWWRETARSDGKVLVDQPDLMDRLIAQIESGAIEGGPQFEALLPMWFEWLIDRTPPMASLMPVYKAFIEGLFAFNQLGDSELELIRRTTVHLLRGGPKPDQYKDHLDRLIDIFQEVRSPNALDWGLDISDALSCHPCRDTDARQRWLSVLVAAALQHRDRLTTAQLTLLRLIARDACIDLGPQLERAEPTSSAELPSGLRILIYSLDEQANQRAALTLQVVLTTCRIDVNADQSCSKRLHNAAKNADVVAFVSSVATHAAFFCIKDAISSSDVLLQVPGSGTSRIVQSVLSQVTQ